MEVNTIQTVGDLRNSLVGRSDNELVYAQVVATDGSAWGMQFTLLPLPWSRNGVVASMRHPDLKTLPPLSYQSIRKPE